MCMSEVRPGKVLGSIQGYFEAVFRTVHSNVGKVELIGSLIQFLGQLMLEGKTNTVKFKILAWNYYWRH